MTIIRLLTEKEKEREGNQTADRDIRTEPITRPEREAERRVILIVCSPMKMSSPLPLMKEGKEKQTKEIKERAIGIGLALEPRFGTDIVTTHV